MPDSPPRLEMPPVRGMCGHGNGRQRQAWPLGRTVLCGSGGRGAELLAERGQFTIAEGNVWSVRERGGTISMNFGRRRSQALTVTILKRHARMFSSAGVWLKRLENRVVRVRGVGRRAERPRIKATRAPSKSRLLS